MNHDVPRIRRRLDAPIPQFPELDHCVGRVVEITVLDDGIPESTDASLGAAPFCQSTISEGADELLPADAGASVARAAAPAGHDSAPPPSHLEVSPADATDAAAPAPPAADAEEPFEHPIEEFLTDWQRARRRGL